MTLAIRILTPRTLDPYVAHMTAHAAESGRDGDPVFMPYGDEEPYDPVPSRQTRARSWRLALGEPGWSRCWGLFDGEVVAGHAELYGADLRSRMHRARLGMGLLRRYRGCGHGGRLLDKVIAWARGQAFLSWIDLGVFAGNRPARALYESRGFVETGAVEDAFRVGGTRIEDVLMALRLRADT